MKKSKTVSIYYDRDCGFCKRSVEHIVRFGRVRVGEVAPAQTRPDIYELMQVRDSWVVENERGERFTTFQGGVEIARHSPWLRFFVPLARPRIMQKIGEWTYRKIANNRSRIPLP